MKNSWGQNKGGRILCQQMRGEPLTLLLGHRRLSLPGGQLVRIHETDDWRTRRTFRVRYYEDRIQRALWTIMISLSSRSFFKTVFRGLSDPDGRVSHYDLVTKLINSQKFGRGGGH